MNQVVSQISMDLLCQGDLQTVYAVQGEANTRCVQVSLFSDGTPWQIPQDALARVRYGSVLQVGGTYDTLPDGERAYTIEGNVVTIVLAPQLLESAGMVEVQVELCREEKKLSTFSFGVMVAANPALGIVESQNYINWEHWLEQELDQYIDKLHAIGQLLGGTMAGPINMNGQKLSGLNLPAEDTEAATKGYVDTAKNDVRHYANTQIRKASPRNLLDNSDFRNPVNQRGITETTAIGYCIDRWRFSRNGTTGALAVTGSGIKITKSDSSEYCDFVQIPGSYERLAGKVMTFAVKCTGYDPVILNFEFGTNTSANGADDCIHIFNYSGKYMYIRVRGDIEEVNIEWAALYEGTYTAETLPEYQPKGYGAELAECMRYFQSVKRYTLLYGSFMSSSAYVFSLPLSVPMRIAPTASFASGGYISVGAVTGWSPSIATSYANNPILRFVATLENHGLSGYQYLQVSGGDMYLNADL